MTRQPRGIMRHPSFWGCSACPLLYWINRVWMMARRGEVDGDPVAFAIKDKRSIAVSAAMGEIFLGALYGPALMQLSLTWWSATMVPN